MRENFNDIVIEKLHERQGWVRKRLAKQYKGVKPFRMEPISSGEMELYYNMLNSEDMAYLRGKHGDFAVNQMIYEMETKGRK